MSQRQVHRVRTVDWKRESRAAGPRRAAFDGRRFWLGVFLGLAGALLATAALAGVPLTANGTDDNAHATAVDGTSGRLHAVYERGGVIYARNRPLGSPWTAEAVVATGTAPAIGLNPTNGRPYVAFVFAGNPYVTSWDGTAWATPAQLDSTASTSEVSLGVANDGTVFAGWNYSNGLASVRFASWYAGVTTVLHSLAGWTIGNPVNCGDLYHEPRVRMGSGTQYYLVYRHSRPGNGCGATGSIEVRSNGAGWTGVANSASVNQADITLGRRPAAVDGGTLHLTWYAGGVRHATVTSAGFAGEAVVSATGSAPAVAVTDGPTIHVAMVDAAGRVEVRTDAGGGFGAPTTIDTATSGRQPGFATFTSGGVLRYAYVTYERLDGADYDVHVQNGVAEIGFAPEDALSLPTVEPHVAASADVSIANVGALPVNVTAIGAAPADGGSTWSVASGGGTPCAAVPFTLAAGASCTVTVTGTPLSPGVKVGALSVGSDAPVSPAGLPLRIAGATPPPGTPTVAASSDSGTVGDAITNVARPAFHGSCWDGDTVAILVNGSPVAPTATCTSGAYTLTPTAAFADGSHAIGARATNAQGSRDSTGSMTLRVDTLPPDTTALAGPADPTASNIASFTFAGTNTGNPAEAVRFLCSLDGEPAYDCASPQDLGPFANGAHRFTVRAVDVAGNADATPQVHDWTIVTAFALTVSRSGAGGGTVTSAPAGIDCGATCAATVLQGTPVTLTPAADAGSYFVRWEGGCTGSFPGGCTVTMSADRHVTAVFEIADTVPDAFTFGSVADVSPGATVASGAVTITGTSPGLPVAIAVANGQYAIGCAGAWTSAPGTIVAGQRVCVRHVAPLALGAATTTTLDVGGVQGTFVTTTAAALDAAGDFDGDGIPNGIEGQEGRDAFVKDNDIFSPGYGAARLFAMQMYRDFLNREGDAAGIEGWAAAVDGGTWTREQAIDGFLASAEFGGFVAPVVRLYFAALGRLPDYAGLLYNAALLRSGTCSLTELADFFARSPEFLATYGALDNAGYVTRLYHNVLGREPTWQELGNWLDLMAHDTSRGRVLLGFSDSDEHRAITDVPVFVTMMYAGMLRRTPDPAGYGGWVALLRTGAYTREQVIGGFMLSSEYYHRFLP